MTFVTLPSERVLRMVGAAAEFYEKLHREKMGPIDEEFDGLVLEMVEYMRRPSWFMRLLGAKEAPWSYECYLEARKRVRRSDAGWELSLKKKYVQERINKNMTRLAQIRHAASCAEEVHVSKKDLHFLRPRGK